MSHARIVFATCVLGFLAGCTTQSPTATDTRTVQPDMQLIRSVEGEDLFGAYCAPCHGTEANGKGMMAPALKAPVPDLTQLSRRNRGQFPETHVRGVLNGDVLLVSHGSQEMPIWGPVFHQVENDTDWGNVRMANLIKYLKSIQTGDDPTGAEMYNQYCAKCHGLNMKGTGPAPEPYKPPPDLTTLTQRNGGTFPEMRVLDILRNGVVIPAHGLADMPAWGSDSRLMDTSKPGQVSERILVLVNYIKSRQVK